MIFLYLLIPLVLMLIVSMVETIFAKRLIKSILGKSAFTYVDDLYGFYSSTGLRVSYPSTPAGKLEAYLMNDLIIISGTVNMLWLFKTQMKPLILLRPNSKKEIKNARVRQIDKFQVFDRRIRIDFNYKGMSKVQYTLGLSGNASAEDKENLKNWFNKNGPNNNAIS